MPKLQMGDDAYRIVGDGGEEGELAEYGVAATLDVGLHHYIALVECEGDGDDVVSLLPDEAWIVDGVAVQGVEVEDVEFAGPGEEEEGEAVAEVDEDDGEEEEEEDDDLVGDEPDEDEEEDEEEEDVELELKEK